MKAMVLAAGFGTRFRPLSERLAKPAAPVLNEPLIRRTLRLLQGAGVDQVLVNLHYRPDDVVAACGGFSGLRVRYQRERKILGTGGGIKRAERFFAGSTAIVFNGDMIFDLDLESVLRFHRRSKALATMVLRPSDQLARYGAVEIDRRGRVRRLLGEPSKRRPGRALMFTGVHVFEPAFFEHLVRGPSCVMRTAYRALVDADAPVYGFESDARWLDIGTPEDYLRANLTLLGKRTLVGSGARIARGATVTNCVVGAGARISPRAQLERCVVWPLADVSEGTQLRDTVVIPASD